MRRAGLLIAGVFLATGAGLAMTAPASAAGRSGGDHHWDCDHGHSYYHHDYDYDDFYYHHHFRHHGGIWIGIGIGLGG
jgi:hypothetical protein